MKIVFVLLLAAACVLSGASTILAVGWIGIISASNSTNSAATPSDVWVTLAIINGIALALVAEKGAVVPWFIPPPQIYESSIESGSSGSKMSHLKNALNFPKAVAETYGLSYRVSKIDTTAAAAEPIFRH
ncbi:hypothetical protein GQ42DRAFT_177416 [Ramicandelaber brevisporus]|nr:hypothetical protein GQ42DRAFT_177416 [Ramicandelaber brevisporus]